MKRLAALMLIVFVCTAAPMCETVPADDPTIVQALVDEAAELIRSTQTQITVLAAQPNLSPAEAGKLAELKQTLAELSQPLTDMQKNADAAGRPVDLGDVGVGLAPLLGPIGIPLAGLIGGIAEFWRTRKKRTSFTQLVGAINSVKKKNAKFSDALDEAGPELRAEMGTTAKDAIDKMRGATTMNVIDRVRNL